MLACIVAGLLAASHAPPASAQGVADTLERWGLLGTWAIDCTRPPSRTNVHLSYVKSGQGSVRHGRDFGKYRDSREVLAATDTLDGMIEVVAEFSLGARRWSFRKGPDGRIRVMSNSRADGTNVTVKDGRFVMGGKATPWLRRCGVGGQSLHDVRLSCSGAARDHWSLCPGEPA
jgi:hypothetical protein